MPKFDDMRLKELAKGFQGTFEGDAGHTPPSPQNTPPDISPLLKQYQARIEGAAYSLAETFAIEYKFKGWETEGAWVWDKNGGGEKWAEAQALHGEAQKNRHIKALLGEKHVPEALEPRLIERGIAIFQKEMESANGDPRIVEQAIQPRRIEAVTQAKAEGRAEIKAKIKARKAQEGPSS